MKKLLAIILIISSLFTLASCGEEMGYGACDYLETRDITDREVYYVEICVKNYGKMVVLLDRTSAPITVDNFLKLVKEGFYDGLTFHRIINNFMIQGGDPKGNGTGGSPDKIYGEFLINGYYNDISHIRGVISMARSNDYNSASSQFFICNANAQSSLDYFYAAFGYVVEGMSVVDAITAENYATGQYNDGLISDKSQQPIIKYIKVLENYTPTK